MNKTQTDGAPIKKVVDTLVKALGEEPVYRLARALQLEEVKRWQSGQNPMYLEREALRFAYSLLMRARAKGVKSKQFKQWFAHTPAVYDPHYEYNVAPANAVAYKKLRAKTEQAFEEFLARR